MSKKGFHCCAGSVFEDGRKILCICGTCKHDCISCCFDHKLTCPAENEPEQLCPDYDKED